MVSESKGVPRNALKRLDGVPYFISITTVELILRALELYVLCRGSLVSWFPVALPVVSIQHTDKMFPLFV